jgi:3-methyladenine DNA glycosylase AlkC
VKALRLVFDTVWLEELIMALQKQGVDFEAADFRKKVFSEVWDELVLKQRIRHIATCLSEVLPTEFSEALPVLESVSKSFSGLPHLVFPDFIELYGLNKPLESLPALTRLTQGSSSEFAVRPFIECNQADTLKLMLQWSGHSNEHIRRLASEGCRPRLPWGRALVALKKEPEPLRPILDALRFDNSLYVRKSVANNLNDISKDHPDWVLGWCCQWHGQSVETDWIIKHGLRTLLKQGDAKALTLIGYKNPQGISVENWTVASEVVIGQKIDFQLSLNLEKFMGQKVRLEYAISFVRKQKTPYRKVFKISEFMAITAVKNINKHHDFKTISTRTYYAGKHKMELLVNGVVMAESEFTVSENRL